MSGIVHQLWLIPVLPLLAAGVLALTPRPHRRFAAGLAIGALASSLLLSCLALAATLGHEGPGVFREVVNFTWFEAGGETVRLGWVLDPLSAAMLVMVTFVGLLIFVYSVGYMAHDPNFTRFFCFLSLFAGAMLGVVIANSLLLLFICWELVGLASYLLIGFWFDKPAAAAAAVKAFLTTRVGDLGLFLGLVWLQGSAGTLLFYDAGRGCLEGPALERLVATTTIGGLAVSTAISLLLLLGAAGKSGQFPLHVWLPDAMEGPTPVSALIHAATMVAAGVFLVARVFPLFDAGAIPAAGLAADPGHGAWPSVARQAVTWLGALTAVFASCVAVAQSDIKRILAWSTVSQLGYMFLGLGVGGVAVGMFHLLTHAFFKALLFLGAGSVIHGCHEEQDIRRMGGLTRAMPVTFGTYAVGMMALAGVPLLFPGFWSKDGILHAAHGWPVSQLPFLLGLVGAFLTAFYMTRQMVYVFRGPHRGGVGGSAVQESPVVMTVPLVMLAGGAVVLGFLGTPAWPALQHWLGEAHSGEVWDPGRLVAPGFLGLAAVSTLIVAGGVGLAWRWYARRPITDPVAPDALELVRPGVFDLLRRQCRVDELYAATVVRWHAGGAALGELLDRWLWGGVVLAVEYATWGLAWAARFVDEWGINRGFDAGCGGVRRGGSRAAGLSDGRLSGYLRTIATAFACLLLLLVWGGCR